MHNFVTTPNILIIAHFNLHLYYLRNFNQKNNVFNCYAVTATQLTTYVPLYSCNITLKMAAVAAETYR